MKKIFYSFLAMAGIFALASCTSGDDITSSDKDNPTSGKLVPMTFTASQEGGTTKAAINPIDTKQIVWSEGDEISIMYIDGYSLVNQTFSLTDGAGTTKGIFSGEAVNTNTYFALYPKQADVSIALGVGLTNVEVPANQVATTNSFDTNAAIMLAKTSGQTIDFKNCVGYFKFVPQFPCTKVVLKGNNHEKIAGKGSVSFSESDNTPALSIDDNGSETIALSGTFEVDKTYYIALAPTDFQYGFTISVLNQDGSVYTKSSSGQFTINRNDVVNLGDLTIDNMAIDNTPYVTFSADAEQTFKFSLNESEIEYSLDGMIWNTLGTQTVTFGGNHGSLKLRGKLSSYAYFRNAQFSNNDVEVAGSGDIRTLVNYEDYKNANMSNLYLYDMFRNCTVLTSAPELNFEVINTYGYMYMFEGCSKLSKVVMLATSISDASYSFESWLENAGTSVTSPILIVSDQLYDRFNTGGDLSSKVPSNWTVIKKSDYDNQSSM